MISFLEGIVAEKGLGEAFLNVQGVGYALSMSQTSIASLPQPGEEARVLCRMMVSDAGVSLYGFASQEERDLFDQLISISGVGPKTALAALSFLSPSRLVSAIVAQDAKTISKIPGIGKKSAQRIILELKDRYKDASVDASEIAAAASAVPSSVQAGVSEALSSMGFRDEEVSFALSGADEGMSESELLQYALKRLA